MACRSVHVSFLAPVAVGLGRLPEPRLLDRVRAAGCKIIASATSAKEAEWLADRGCDAIIAQRYEAGGHRGMFLTDNVASQTGTFALVPQVADAVKVPVIAAGGISDAWGITAAFALGAAAVQIGTAYQTFRRSSGAPKMKAREPRRRSKVLTQKSAPSGITRASALSGLLRCDLGGCNITMRRSSVRRMWGAVLAPQNHIDRRDNEHRQKGR